MQDNKNMPAQILDVIENEGYIKSMKLPNGWVDQAQPRPQWAGPYWHTFRPDGKDKVRLSFFDRGRPLTEPGKSALRALFERAPSALTPGDLRSIAEVLRDAAVVEEFNFLNARTEKFNDRPVVVIEGRWVELQEDCLWMIAADADCTWVNEVIYQASKTDYPIYLKQIRDCLKTIEWK
jgi:hypothetical protein